MKRMKRSGWFSYLLLAVFLISCAPAPLPSRVTDTPTHVISATAAQTTVSPSPVPSPTASRLLIRPDEEVPRALINSWLKPEQLMQDNQAARPDVQLALNGERPFAVWIYALAAPFATIAGEVSGKELRELWASGKMPGTEVHQLLVSEETMRLLESAWGQPSPAVKALPEARLLDVAWAPPYSWAILPFEQLEPRWKVLSIDGQSPVHKDFDARDYPLAFTFGLQGAEESLARFAELIPTEPHTNRDEGKITTVMVTGVTALVRGTAALMEYAGMDYPAEEIKPALEEADLLHINNEIPFAKNCPSPYPWSGLTFCSQERYIKLLEDIGTDVVELAGDHFADWGDDAMRFTLELYKERNWPVYGGGSNITEAKKPAYFEVNGNRIAFIGCNYKAPGYATASDTRAGAVHCDPAWLHPLITQVKEEGYLPIVTFQDEEYYEYISRASLQEHFRGAAAAGAVIVSGSQAHQPHAIELTGDASMFYGLGNLFFDQVVTDEATRWAMLTRHIIYENRHISTEILTIYFVDLAKSRFTTPEENERLLRKVFEASGWETAPQNDLDKP